MNKLKLLLISKDFSQWIHTERYYLQKELSHITDLVVWHEQGNIHHILNKIKFVPDFILIYLYGSRNCPSITGLDTLDIPYGVYVEDVHSLKDFPNSVNENNIKHIFNCYRDAFIKKYPQFTDKMIWFPHHVNLNLFKDLGNPKDIPMLMMGAVNKHYYPLRYRILRMLSEHQDFVYHRHPGYRNISDKEGKFVREKYVMEINRAKIFFTCDSIFKYPVKKYYEVLACKTLLLAPDSKELYDLGFRDGENFVAINKHDFLEKAEYYLRNEQERERIANNGYNLVREKHSTQIRAKGLITIIEKVLNKPSNDSRKSSNE
ncbi:MAG TPA: glycosyltransferase [Pseudoneobacillus sp.]|nr:glycosyltransferase [Pseudoneobacillus sp.]